MMTNEMEISFHTFLRETQGDLKNDFYFRVLVVTPVPMMRTVFLVFLSSGIPQYQE